MVKYATDEYTSGPWKAVQCEQGPPVNRVPDPNEWRVNAPNERLPAFRICSLTRETADENLEANARLIAAAPDMLALLLRLHEWDHMQPPTADGAYWLREIAEVVAKARGEQ